MNEIKTRQAQEPEIIINIATPKDAEALSQIKQRVWLTTYQNKELAITAEDILTKDFLCKQRIEKRAEHMGTNDSTNRTLVARAGTQIAGYGRAVKGADVHEIVTLYLLPEWQGRGIGSNLLKRLLDWLGDEKVVTLGVASFNTPAIRFYEKFGFRLGKQILHDEATFPSGKDLPEIQMLLAKPTSY